MKKIAFVIAAILLPLLSHAQEQGIVNLYEKYSGKDGFTTLDMSGEMFRAINSSSSRKDGTNDISRIIIIVAETDSDSFRKDVDKMLSQAKFKRLSTVRSDGENVELYLNEGTGTYREFLMNTYGEDEHVVIFITGNNLNINTLSEITGHHGS